MEKKRYDSPAPLISTHVTWVFSPQSIIGGDECLRGNKHKVVHDKGGRKGLRPSQLRSLGDRHRPAKARQGIPVDGAAPAKLRPVTPLQHPGRMACVGTKSRCVLNDGPRSTHTQPDSPATARPDRKRSKTRGIETGDGVRGTKPSGVSVDWPRHKTHVAER